MASAAPSLVDLEKDPRLFLYTSLTAGSSHIITATSRMETILKANRIPFQAIDMATDEQARRLWQRRAGKRKLPGLVKEGFVIGDLAEVEEWNEYGELKENIGPIQENAKAPAGGQKGVNIASQLPGVATSAQSAPKLSQPLTTGASQGGMPKGVALPGAQEMAARNLAKKDAAAAAAAKTAESSTLTPAKPETVTTAPAEKAKSIEEAKEEAEKQHPAVDHLSAPASRIQSGTATPQPEGSKEETAIEGKTETEMKPTTTTAESKGETARTEVQSDNEGKKRVSGETEKSEKGYASKEVVEKDEKEEDDDDEDKDAVEDKDKAKDQGQSEEKDNEKHKDEDEAPTKGVEELNLSEEKGDEKEDEDLETSKPEEAKES